MILVINTSGVGLEFVLDDKYKHVDTEKQSAELPAACADFLTACGAKWSDLTAIGVVVGPGSFTGIRLGIAYAKGLALGLNIPLVPINAFELYLHDAPDAFVAIDSGRGDFFVDAAAYGAWKRQKFRGHAHPCEKIVLDRIQKRQRKAAFPLALPRVAKVVFTTFARKQIRPTKGRPNL